MGIARFSRGGFAGRGLRGFATGLIFIGIFGCTTLEPAAESDAAQPIAAGDKPVWQRIRFFVHWPENEDPAWYIDALLAHKVVGPVLEKNRASIHLWRFHRRANRDSAGHSLSFLVYAPASVTDALCQKFQTDRYAGRLIREGVLDKMECQGFPKDKRHLIEATSDTQWSLPVQRTWPYFIMGVSEMWLQMIDQHSRKLSEKYESNTLEQTREHYSAVHEAVTTTWREEGEHAFLHHLSALFGYSPISIAIRERKLIRF